MRLVEEWRNTRLDQVSAALERSDVIGRESKAPRTVRDGLSPRAPQDGTGQSFELRFELGQRQVGRVGVASDVLLPTRRRLPCMMMRTDFTVPLFEKRAQDVRRLPVGCDGMGDDVGRTYSMSREQCMEPRQRVDVLEALVQPRHGIPLVVTL